MSLEIKIEITMQIRNLGDDASAAVTPQPTPDGKTVPTTSTVTGPMLKLGQINALLSPLSLSAECLSHLGFEPAGREKAAKLYRASDFPAICAALVQHIQRVQATQGGAA